MSGCLSESESAFYRSLYLSNSTTTTRIFLAIYSDYERIKKRPLLPVNSAILNFLGQEILRIQSEKVNSIKRTGKKTGEEIQILTFEFG